MRTSIFSRSVCWTLGLVIFSNLISTDFAWSQGGRQRGGDRGGNDRGGGNRPGPKGEASFLTIFREDKNFASSLKLSKDQEDQVSKLRDEMRGLYLKKLSTEEFVQVSKDIEDRAIAVLDENQKSTWEKRKLEAGPPKNDGANDRSSRSDSGSATSAARADGSPPRGTFPDEKPPEGEIAVVSFGANAVAKASKDKNYDGSDEAPSKPVADSKTVNAKEEPKLHFNFRYAPWSDILKLFADINNLTLDMDRVPPGTFNYYDDGVYTMTQTLDILNGYLIPKGYVLVRRNRFLVCWNLDDGPIPPNYIPSVTEDELPSRGDNEVISLMMPLEGLEAEKMVTEIEPLLGPLGSAKAMKSSNSLILTGLGSNIRRIHKLLKTIKVQFVPGDNVFRAISLKHITASEAERTVRRHFGLNPTVGTVAPTGGGFGGRGGGGGNPWGNGGGGGGNPWGGGGGGNPWGGGGGGNPWGGGGGRGDRGGNDQTPQVGAPQPGGGGQSNNAASPFAGKIHVTADSRLNILIVTASTQLIKLVEDIVKSIDTKPDRDAAPIETPPTSIVQYTVPGDVPSMIQVLNNVTNGAVLGGDARSGKIYVQGTKEDHAEIQKLLRNSDNSTHNVAVISLTRLEPITVTNSLRNLFVSEGTRAPSIEADASGRRIIVRGSGDQLSQVKAILHDMGETSVSVSPDGERAADEDRGNIRKLDLRGLDPDLILDLVQRTWGASGQSPIRIVIPSQPNPIRDRRVPSATVPELRPGTTEFNQNQSPIRQPVQPSGDKQSNVTTRTRAAVESDSNGLIAENPSPAIAQKRSRTQQIIPRRVLVIEASRLQESANVNAEPAQDSKPDAPDDDAEEIDEARPRATSPSFRDSEEKPKNERPGQPKKQQDSPKSAATEPDPDKPISAMLWGNELIITGEDKKKLDQLEDIISSLIGAIPQRPRWTVFYLRTADATECAQMLERLFPQSSVTTSATSSSDGLFGGLTSGFSTFGRGMMNATGLNQTLGGQNLRIITDVRSNALYVSGSPEIVNDVEYMLRQLDASDAPASLRDRTTHSIPVLYADIDDVKELIDDVFKYQMTPEQSQQQGGGPQGMNPFAMMFGGGRGQGGGGNQQRRAAVPELSVGVDRGTSHLIVQCNEKTFREVEETVQKFDQRAKEANRTVHMIALKTADPIVVSTTLSSLIPKVSVSSTRPRARRGQTQDSTNRGTPGSQPSNQPPDITGEQQMLQQMMNRNSQSFYGNQGGGNQGGNNRNRGGGNGGGGQRGRGN